MAELSDTGKTLAQLVTINNKNLSATIADNLLEAAPAIAAMASVPASNGTDHQWLTYDTAPPGGFRILNDGVVQGQSVDANVTVNCKIVDYSYFLDTRAVANYTQGDLIARENARHLRSAFAKVEQQVFAAPGSSFLDAAGFAGIVGTGRLDALSNAMVVNATGSAAGAVTSVYLLHDDPMAGCALVMGSDGNIVVSPAVRQMINGDTAGTRLSVWSIEIASYFAFQWGGNFNSSRICNIDPTGGTGNTLSDDMIADAISRHPSDRKPRMIVMNRDCERQLRQNRTATNGTGAPAPFAESAFGIPIVVTDQIGNDETVVT